MPNKRFLRTLILRAGEAHVISEDKKMRISIITVIFGVVILLLGFLALYFFTIVSLQNGAQILAHQVVLATGITSIGVFFILFAFNFLKSPFFVMISLISFLFASYSAAFDV